MKNLFKLELNQMKNSKENYATELFSKENTMKIHKFHQSMGDSYNVTPLVRLKELSNHLGLQDIFVKDESLRGNLKAFKLLGGAYSVAKSICKKLSIDISEVDFDYLKSNEVKNKLGDLTFAAASDGNHGKSVAWAANEFNQSCIVYMPKGTVQDRVTAIEELGSEVIVTNMNYDGCVSEVNKLGSSKGWEVILDTASEGDKEVASWVMQGYATMTYEAISQMNSMAIKPTHIFVQAGVGSLAASVMGVVLNYYSEVPKLYTLEPHQANCFYLSGLANDGLARSVEGDMESISAGLSCGVPNPISWELIRNFADGFISCDDLLAANGMRILGNPLKGDMAITSGESGSIGTGFIDYVMKNKELRKKFDLDASSTVLLFSTEGDTDRVNYRDIVWYGKVNSK